MFSVSSPLLGPHGKRSNWCKLMRRFKKNTRTWSHDSPMKWLCRQPYQMANEWNWPRYLNRYGFPRYPRTPGHMRPDKDRPKYCNMSSVHQQDREKKGLRKPDHLVNSIGPDFESGHALLKSRDIKHVRSYV